MSVFHGAVRYVNTVTIQSGQSESSELSLRNGGLVGLFLPAVWTSAAITFLAQDPGNTYRPVRDAFGVEISLTGFTAGDYIIFPAGAFHGLDKIKIRSGVVGAAVNQAALRTFYAVFRAFR